MWNVGFAQAYLDGLKPQKIIVNVKAFFLMTRLSQIINYGLKPNWTVLIPTLFFYFLVIYLVLL